MLYYPALFPVEICMFAFEFGRVLLATCGLVLCFVFSLRQTSNNSVYDVFLSLRGKNET